jgi:integrase
MVLQKSVVVAFPQSTISNNRAKARRIRFTQNRVEGLRPGGKGVEYIYDSDKPGLAVRVTSGGARTFVFVGRVHGEVVRIKLGRVESLPLAKARAAVDKIRGDVALGIDVMAERRALRAAEAERKSLNDVFEQFVASDRHKPKTERDYRSLWRLYVQAGLGKKAIKDIASDDVKKTHASVAAAESRRVKAAAERQAAQAAANGAPVRANRSSAAVKGASKEWKGHRTANKVAALVRAVLAFAGRKADNPATDLAWFKQAPRRRRLSDEEAQTFRRALEGFEPAWRDFFTLLLLTGARRQSLLTMRWCDVDLELRRWIIPASWSKNSDEMVVPLTSETSTLLSEMKRRRGSSPWVFPSDKSASGHIEEPKAAWARLLRQAGIECLRVHDLRRTFGSRLAETGASGAVIAAAMGHKSLQSARSYLHLQVDAVREAAERASIKVSNN